MPTIQELIGETVVGKDGAKKNVSDFCGSGKVVGIYFSAHWCPPCRGFTPKLAEFYKAVKASANGANFEIVFVSSDRDKAGFDEYYAEMPWLALDYEDRETKDKVAGHFGVRGIPTFVILDGEGNVISTEGRGIVMEDLKGEKFPWK